MGGFKEINMSFGAGLLTTFVAIFISGAGLFFVVMGVELFKEVLK